MGTEIQPRFELYLYHHTFHDVKLNNPLMGTEINYVTL